MKKGKIDIFIRYAFNVIICILFLNQVLLTLQVFSLLENVVFQNVRIIIYNCTLYLCFIVYCIVMSVINKFRPYYVEKKHLIISFVIPTLIIIFSFFIINPY